MEKQNVNLDFSLKKTDSTRNYLLEEIKHNDLMGENIRNYVGISFENFLVFVSTVSSCVSISAFVC